METIHVHHVCEQYVTKLAKLSARKKVLSYKQYVESILANTPLDNIEDVVRNAADRAFTQEKIIELCYDAYLNGIGKHSYPQYIPPIFKLHSVKSELKKKTIYSIKESLGSEVCAELIKHITFKIQIDTIQDVINVAIRVFLTPFLLMILFPLSIVAAVTPALVPRLPIQNVNSRSFSEGVAKEIYRDLSDNRYNIIKEISSHLRQSFNATNEHLKTVAENLEDFSRRIDLIE